jgi:hypothetical protein
MFIDVCSDIFILPLLNVLEFVKVDQTVACIASHQIGLSAINRSQLHAMLRSEMSGVQAIRRRSSRIELKSASRALLSIGFAQKTCTPVFKDAFLYLSSLSGPIEIWYRFPRFPDLSGTAGSGNRHSILRKWLPPGFVRMHLLIHL